MSDQHTSTDTDKKAEERFQSKVSIGIATIAALLLINDLGADNANSDAGYQNTVAINTFAFFQAKTIRQNDLHLTADTLEAIVKSSAPVFGTDAKRDILALAQEYRTKALAYDSEPATGEGRKELLEKAKAAESIRDRAMAKDPYFDLAALLLQMSIIMLSVVLITRRRTLLLTAIVTAFAGSLLSLNAFTGLVSIPGLG